MNLRRFFVTAFVLSLVLATILPASAQTSKGIIAGVVRDKTGAVIPGAKVTLTSQDTSETRAAVADERGAVAAGPIGNTPGERCGPGVRRIERAVEDVTDPQADVVRGYCAAVRSAITDDGHPPLTASGLKLKGRLEAVADSLGRVTEKGGRRRRLSRCGI